MKGMNEANVYTSSLKQRKVILAMRWDSTSQRVSQMNWKDIGIATLASRCGLVWYRARGNEPVADFLGFDGKSLVERRSLGIRKIERLCMILERALDTEQEENVTGITSLAADFDPHETLIFWGVSLGFPCRLSRLPVRIVNFCENRGLVGIGELLDEWERLGFEGFKAQQNLGSKSVRQMATFVESLRERDLKIASLFIPIDSSGEGLSLGRALTLIAKEPSPSERSILDRRLVQRMTLETSAEEAGLTRERVRQIEAKFLGEVSEVLDYFHRDRTRLLAAWVGDGDWLLEIQGLQMENHELLMTAALEAVYRETPQAVARSLGEESRLENWQDELLFHPELWFGGVSFADFLTERIPASEQNRFCEYVSESSRLRLDHFNGRVHPTRTGLRKTVEAILALEDDPIPLTWLMKLLTRTGYHPSLMPSVLLRHRRRWIAEFKFPAEMILWDE